MSKDKKELKPLEVEANLTYKDENVVQNAEIESAQQIASIPEYKEFLVKLSETNIYAHYDENGKLIIDNKETTTIFDKTYNLADYYTEEVPAMDLVKLQQFYHDNGNSTEKTYEYLKSYIMENKENPEALNSAISCLLDNVADFYDYNMSHGGVANTQLEVFDKIMNAPGGSEIKGMICGPIHEFAMNLLHECGINAVLPMGTMVGGGAHVTLMYQRHDGKYVFNDYGNSIVLDSTNVLDALREVSKKSGDIECTGYLTLINGGKTSYQKFAYREENVFGHEMDKGDYDNNSPFEHTIADSSKVKANVEVSNLGNVSAEVGGTLAYGNENLKQETSLTLGYKTSGETAMFNFSQSVGVKVEHKQVKLNDNGSTFLEVKGIVSNIQGQVGGVEYENPTQDALNRAYEGMNIAIANDLAAAGIAGSVKYSAPQISSVKGYTQVNNLTAFARTTFGKVKTLFKNDKLELSNVGQLSGTFGGSLCLDKCNTDMGGAGDIRLAAEDGLSLTNRGTNFSINNNLSAGVVGDLKIKYVGPIPLGIQPGVKLNAGTGFDVTPSANVSFGASAKAYGVVTQPAKNYGAGTEVHATYRPDGSKVTLYGQAGVGLGREQLTIGGFNERVEDRTTFTALVGANVNNKVSINAGYRQEINPLDRTKNYSTFNVGATVRF